MECAFTFLAKVSALVAENKGGSELAFGTHTLSLRPCGVRLLGNLGNQRRQRVLLLRGLINRALKAFSVNWGALEVIVGGGHVVVRPTGPMGLVRLDIAGNKNKL